MARLSIGVMFVAFTSVICGIGMTGVSSWVLHKSLQDRKNPTLVTATDLLHQVNTFFGGTTGLYDLDVIFRILISASAAALAGGGVQFLSSLCLLLCGVTGKMKKPLAAFWITIQILVLFAVGGALLCILTNELQVKDHLKIFLISAGADVVVIMVNCIILAIASCRTKDDSSSTKRNFGANYAPVAKASAPPKTLEKSTPENDMSKYVPNLINGYEKKSAQNGVQVFPSAAPNHGLNSSRV